MVRLLPALIAQRDVVIAGGISSKRRIAAGGILDYRWCLDKRCLPIALLSLPVVLISERVTAVGVLLAPVVLNAGHRSRWRVKVAVGVAKSEETAGRVMLPPTFEKCFDTIGSVVVADSVGR